MIGGSTCDVVKLRRVSIKRERERDIGRGGRGEGELTGGKMSMKKRCRVLVLWCWKSRKLFHGIMPCRCS